MPDDREYALGTELRRLRIAVGLTQEELAERANLTVDAISALERGARRRPYLRTLQALADALGLAAEARATFIALAKQSTPLTPVLPIDPAPTPLIGRETELMAIGDLLNETRLLTLFGPGGVGKTRLARRAAARNSTAYSDGVVFVTLETLRDSHQVLAAIAAALDLRMVSNAPILTTLTTYLQNRTVLLVLDNLDHLTAAGADLARLLIACPRLTLLATSRTPLNIQFERVFPIAPLALPAPGAEMSQAHMLAAPAVQLFIQRVQARVPDFAVTEANAPVIAEICRQLAGLPLALELGAARLPLLGLHDLLDRLNRALPVLSGGPRDLPERHQTMWGAIAWSYDLLPAAEQKLFCALSVFAGGWSLTNAERLLAEASGNAMELTESMGRLIEHSLIILQGMAEEQTRYGFLVPIQTFARRQLMLSGDAERLHHAHATIYQQLVRNSTEKLTGADPLPRLMLLVCEHENLRSAINWRIDHGDYEQAVDICWNLLWYWLFRSHILECQEYMERILANGLGMGRHTQLRAQFLLGVMYFHQGRLARAAGLLEPVCAEAQAFNDTVLLAGAQQVVGVILTSQGAYADAERMLDESITLFLAQNNLWGAGYSVLARLQVALLKGDTVHIHQLLEWGDTLLSEQRTPYGKCTVLELRALLALLEGDYTVATPILCENIALALTLDDKAIFGFGLTNLAGVLAMTGRLRESAYLFGMAEAMNERTGRGMPYTSIEMLHKQHLAVLYQRLPMEELNREWQRGRLSAFPLDTQELRRLLDAYGSS